MHPLYTYGVPLPPSTPPPWPAAQAPYIDIDERLPNRQPPVPVMESPTLSPGDDNSAGAVKQDEMLAAALDFSPEGRERWTQAVENWSKVATAEVRNLEAFLRANGARNLIAVRESLKNAKEGLEQASFAARRAVEETKAVIRTAQENAQKTARNLPDFTAQFLEQISRFQQQASRMDREAKLYFPILRAYNDVLKLTDFLLAQESATLRLEWDGYLQTLGAAHSDFSALRAAQVAETWQAIKASFNAAPPPQTALAEDGTFVMSWDRGTHHFEIEMFADGSCEWFYLDLSSTVRDGEEGLLAGALSATMLGRLATTFGEQWKS